jgi:SAM-dependent methyltransferase
MIAREAFVARRFDALAGRFRAAVDADDFRLLALIRGLDPGPGRRLLDVGCGKGRFAARLAGLGSGVVGLDPSPAMIGAASGITKVLGSARRLPFAAASFDGAYAVEVLEHLDDDGLERAIAEMARVVRPGGRVVLIDKNRRARDARRPWLAASLVKWIDERRGRWMYRPGEPVRERWFTGREVARLMVPHLSRVRWEFLARPEEAAPIFERRPSTRRFIAWTGVAP